MRKIAILGTAPLSRALAPCDDPEWEVWVCSAGNMSIARVTQWFELHAIVELEAPDNKQWADTYLPWLRSQPFPIWMIEQNDLIPQAKVFPCRELLAEFGREWFTSSVAWMLAFAITQKPDEIGIFGVDMASDIEHYTAQRAGCRRWIEIAKERGIEVTIPWESCLGNPPPIYGLWESTPMGRRINVTEQLLTQKHAEIKQAEESQRMQRCFFEGALEQLRYFKRTFANGADAFDHMDGLPPELENAAAAWANANAPNPAPNMTLAGAFATEAGPAATLTAIAPSAGVLRDPPPVEAAEKPARALNGSGRHRPAPAQKTHVRASERRARA